MLVSRPARPPRGSPRPALLPRPTALLTAFLPVPALALALLSAAACGRAPAARAAAPSAAGDTVYIGTTGTPSNPRDITIVRGVALAVARLNAERAPGAPPFGVRLPAPPAAAPGGAPQSQVAVAAAFRDDSLVVGVVGPTASGAALTAAPVFADAEHGGARPLVALTPTASNPAVARANPWMFRLAPTDDEAVAALTRFAAESLRVRRVAVVFRNDTFGRSFVQRVGPAFAALGVEVTERDPYLTGVTRYEAYAARIARRGADALLVAGNGADAEAVVRAVRAAGARPAVLGTDDLAQMARTLADDPAMRGIRFVTFFDPAAARGGARDSAAAAFVAAYRRRFADAPDHRAALSYDATLLIGRAAREARADGVRDAQALRAAVRDRLARVGGAAPAFAGAAGLVRFDAERGAVGRRIWIGRVGA